MVALVLSGGHTVDLASGRVDRHGVLGRTIPGVTAALGRPDYRTATVLGWGARPDFALEVRFRREHGVRRAWSLAFERGVRDVKLGDLLARSSIGLQQAIRAGYRGTFVLVRPYRCRPSRCSGEFAARGGSLHVGFGTQAELGTYLTVWTS